MSESEASSRVNKNETAPIFEIADYGICATQAQGHPDTIEAFAPLAAK